MEKRKSNLISLSVIFSLLLVFGFYSSTINYASALTASSFTVTTYDLRGSTYNSENNAWYFASPNNNTMIRLPNNSTTPVSMPVNGNSNCADPEDILSLDFASGQFIALWCDNGAVATHGLMIRDSLTNAERDFESNIFNTEDGFIMVESLSLDTMYVVNHGAGSSPQIAVFNLQAINSTIQNMFIGSIGFNGQCGTVYSAVVNQVANELWATCSRVTTNANTLVRVDLSVSSAVEFITLTGTSGTLTVDYNEETEKIAVVDYTANDLWIVDDAASVIDYTNTSICPAGGGLSPQFNENVNQLYIMCNVSGTGANTILLFDVPSQTVVTSFSAGTSVSGVQGGGSYWIQQHFEDSVGRLYATFGWTQNGGSGAVSNTITTIFDDSNVGGVDDEFCNRPENVNLLRCVLGDDELTGVGEEVGTGLINVACNVIFMNCSVTDDPAVNGMGLLAFIASIFIVIGMFYWAIGKDAFAMPIFVWIVIIIALSAFFTLTGLIDPIFLILSIIAIIALAAPKVVGQIQNRGFGGGSSE